MTMAYRAICAVSLLLLAESHRSATSDQETTRPLPVPNAKGASSSFARGRPHMAFSPERCPWDQKEVHHELDFEANVLLNSPHCKGAKSPEQLLSLKRFEVTWKAAAAKYKNRLSELSWELLQFTEAAWVAAENITNPMQGLVSDDEKLARFVALTQENYPLVLQLTDRIDRELGTKSCVSIKSTSSILEKARRPSKRQQKPWYQMQHLGDSLRFMIAINELQQVVSILRIFIGADFFFVKIDIDGLLSSKLGGWRAVSVNLRMPNGQMVECLVAFERMVLVLSDEHMIYERYRRDGNSEKQLSATDLMIAEKCFGLAFMRSLRDKGLGATTFIIELIRTIQQMVDAFKKPHVQVAIDDN